jgi:hypothetical protein
LIELLAKGIKRAFTFMDVNHALFDAYEQRFNALAEKVDTSDEPRPALDSVRLYLCLYGENGFSPEEELRLLAELEAQPVEALRKVEVSADYWQEVILYLP